MAKKKGNHGQTTKKATAKKPTTEKAGNAVTSGDSTNPPVVDLRLSRDIEVRKKDASTACIRMGRSMLGLRGTDLVISDLNIVAIFLSMSDKAKAQAKDLFENRIFPNIIENEKGGFVLKDDDTASLVADYVERIFAAYIFAYSAVEAFSNSIIPEDYVYVDKSEKRHTATYNKAQIEKYVKLKDKYTKIIPGIYNISSPADERFWNTFTELESSRNEIIHVKFGGDHISKHPTPILQHLFVDFVKRDSISSCRELIAWVVERIPDNRNIPRGFRAMPFLGDPPIELDI
jgi:hypothetical protein